MVSCYSCKSKGEGRQGLARKGPVHIEEARWLLQFYGASSSDELAQANAYVTTANAQSRPKYRNLAGI